MTSSLADRMARLETTNRVLLVLVGLPIVLAFLGFRFSQPASATETVSAKAFRLVDGDGKTLAELKQGEKGPRLFILDNEGKERLAVTHEADQTGLFVFDEEGQVRVGAAQFSHGGGGFALHGPAAKGAAVLYLKGQGSLRFFDAEGQVTSRIPQ